MKKFWWIAKNYNIYWTFLPADLRYWGFKTSWWDGPIYQLGLWFGHFYLINKNT